MTAVDAVHAVDAVGIAFPFCGHLSLQPAAKQKKPNRGLQAKRNGSPGGVQIAQSHLHACCRGGRGVDHISLAER